MSNAARITAWWEPEFQTGLHRPEKQRRMIGGRHYCNHPARAVQQRPRPNNDSRPIANAAAGDSGQRDRTCCKQRAARRACRSDHRIWSRRRGHFSSSVARSSVAAGKWFLQRLDGEKPDVFCHATQLMHGADSLPVGQRVRFDLASNVRRAVTPLNAVDRMYVSRAGFSAKGQTQSSATLLCRTYCPWYATAKPFAPDGAEGRAVVRQ